MSMLGNRFFGATLLATTTLAGFTYGPQDAPLETYKGVVQKGDKTVAVMQYTTQDGDPIKSFIRGTDENGMHEMTLKQIQAQIDKNKNNEFCKNFYFCAHNHGEFEKAAKAVQATTILLSNPGIQP